MFAIFLQGLMLGYGAALPLGPINVLIANYALHSYAKALAMGMGAMSADITYLLLILYGVIGLLQGTLFLKVVGLFGGIFLLYLAYSIFVNRHQVMEKKRLQNERIVKIFIKGWTLTMLNPYTVGFWLSISTLGETQEGSALWLIAGLVVAITSWTTLMPLAIYRTKHLFSPRIITLFSLFSSAILGFFGFKLLLAIV